MDAQVERLDWSDGEEDRNIRRSELSSQNYLARWFGIRRWVDRCGGPGKGKLSFPGKGDRKKGDARYQTYEGYPSNHPNHEAFFLSIRYDRKPLPSSHVSTSTVSSKISSTWDGRFSGEGRNFRIKKEKWRGRRKKYFLLLLVSTLYGQIRLVPIRSERREISKTNVKIPWARKKRRKVVAKMQRPPREICTHGLIPGWQKSRETLGRVFAKRAAGIRMRPGRAIVPFPFPSRCSFPDPRDATCVPALQTRTTGRGLSTVNKGWPSAWIPTAPTAPCGWTPTHPPTSGPRDFARSTLHGARTCAVIANTSLLHPIASHVSRNRAGFFECLFWVHRERTFQRIPKKRGWKASDNENEGSAKSRGDEPMGGPSGFFFFLMDFREARFRWISSVEQRPFRLIYYTG